MDAIDETGATPRKARRTKSAETPAVIASADADVVVDGGDVAADGAPADAPAQAANAAEPASPDPELERRRIREQLEVLQRKQAELRRALAIADHPTLADALRAVEGRAYAVARAEAKIAEGLSKSEERRRDALEKKIAAARAKRDELDAQIAELEGELAPLGAARVEAFELERREMLEKLMAALSTHDAAFAAAGLEVTSLLPELARWMPEVRAIAEEIVARGRS